MRLYVRLDDEYARSFVLKWLKATESNRTKEWQEYWLSGGGERPIAVSTAFSGELKGPYSCRLDREELPKILSWREKCVVVRLNPDIRVLQREIRSLLGQLESNSKAWVATKRLRGRGGSELYEHLAYTGRIARSTIDVPVDLPANAYFSQSSGYTTTVVTYGTSDAANVFELLQAIKAGWVLLMPVIFDQYASSHLLNDYWKRVMWPSLHIIHSSFGPHNVGLLGGGKFTQEMNPEIVMDELVDEGLTVAADAPRMWRTTFAGWERMGMELVAAKVMQLLNIRVFLKVVTTESLYRQTPFWSQPLPQYARQLDAAAGHAVGVVNTSDTTRLTTRDKLPPDTLEQIHARGWWLAGYPVYQLSYSLGLGGGVVHLVKDGSKGQVHRLARPYLEDPASGLYLLPVNLFRLHAAGQDENASIDPWVFLELLKRWGDDKARRYVQQIWDLIEIPLQRDHVGRETRVAVSLDGLEVQVKET